MNQAGVDSNFSPARKAALLKEEATGAPAGALVLPAGRRLLDQRSDSNATWRAGTLEMPPNSGLLLLLG